MQSTSENSCARQPVLGRLSPEPALEGASDALEAEAELGQAAWGLALLQDQLQTVAAPAPPPLPRQRSSKQARPQNLRGWASGSGQRQDGRRQGTTGEASAAAAAREAASAAAAGAAAAQPGQSSADNSWQQAEGQQPGPQCLHCGTCSSGGGKWERHPITGARLCVACRSYMRKHPGETRPVGVRCLQCRGSSRGDFRGAAWHEHPATGERWLCHSCFHRARHEADQRRCADCGAGSPGGSSHWCRLPGSEDEWLCGRCQAQATRAQRRQRQQEEGHREQDGQGEAGGGVQTPSSNWEAAQPAKRRREAELAPLQPQQALQAQQAQQLPPGDILGLLVAAAGSAAGAAAGLTTDLAAAFSALLDRLVPAEQVTKEARLRLLLSLGEHSAAARLMLTALRIGLAQLAIGGEE